MFAWTGDAAKKGNDFLAVIDADPASSAYGRLITTVGTDQQTTDAHHTEYVMPPSGMLFANDHYSGRTFIFDVRDPIHPKIAASFNDMAGYMHPHSYLRLPNGHVLATFQHAHHAMGGSELGVTGGLVELDDSGQVVRSASSADPAFPDALLTPYSLVVLPELDRVVSTNSSMHDDDIFKGVTFQVWRLSDLKLLETSYFDVGKNRYAHISPEEPRLAPMDRSSCRRWVAASRGLPGCGRMSPARSSCTRFPATGAASPPSSGTSSSRAYRPQTA